MKEAGMENLEKEREDLTLEEVLELLDETIKELESGQLTLDASFACYQKGMELVKQASGHIDRVEKKIQILQEESEACRI